MRTDILGRVAGQFEEEISPRFGAFHDEIFGGVVPVHQLVFANLSRVGDVSGGFVFVGIDVNTPWLDDELGETCVGNKVGVLLVGIESPGEAGIKADWQMAIEDGGYIAGVGQPGIIIVEILEVLGLNPVQPFERVL